MTVLEMTILIQQQREEIARLRSLYKQVDKQRKTALRKLARERDFADFVTEKYNGCEGVS